MAITPWEIKGSEFVELQLLHTAARASSMRLPTHGLLLRGR